MITKARRWAHSEDEKAIVIEAVRGKTIQSIDFVDSIGGEEVFVVFTDGSRLVLEVEGEYIDVKECEMRDA